MVLHGHDELHEAIAEYKRTVSSQAPPLISVFPPLVVSNILLSQLPAWLAGGDYEPLEVPIKDIFSLDPKDHQAAFGWFREMPRVTVVVGY
jgi:hypothetical protein